jgi:hypothetical protein
MTATRNQYGAWVISTFVGNYLVSRQYYGYTKREALACFREETRS